MARDLGRFAYKVRGSIDELKSELDYAEYDGPREARLKKVPSETVPKDNNVFFPVGTVVKLDARPAATSSFRGWEFETSCQLAPNVTVAAIVAVFALLLLRRRVPDEEHAFGYTKALFFSSALEGALVLAAAALIVVTAVGRLFMATTTRSLLMIRRITLGAVL